MYHINIVKFLQKFVVKMVKNTIRSNLKTKNIFKKINFNGTLMI